MTIEQPLRKHSYFNKYLIITILTVFVTIGLCILAYIYRNDIMNQEIAREYGLLGVFIVSFVASSTFSIMPIPIPYMVVTASSPVILAAQFGIWAPVWVGLVTAVGATVGQFITFMIGYSGGSYSKKISQRVTSSMFTRAQNWVKKRGGFGVFLMSVMANPLHLPMTLAFAAFRYPPYLFLIFTFLGVFVKSLAIAFAGYYSLNTVMEWVTYRMSTLSLILTLLLIFIIILIAAIWQLLVLRKETMDKNTKYKAACDYGKSCGKPVLVVGGPWGTRAGRRIFKKPAHGSGDVCLDIDPRALTGHHCPVVASATHIPFADKTFGAVFLSHVLEHLPTVEDARQAIEEMKRVADEVYIVYPSRQSIGGWLTPGHHLWVWQDGDKIYLKQRGEIDNRENIVVEVGNHRAA
ncbi:MAG: VTT domain-containing protein [Dehalococcoidales bacterium]|nr:VTT domain-containing protein [Dehalococcoidales bacterium]